MRTVGIRELKAHLSRVLQEVQRGDVVLVTDRGRVVAELRSPGSTILARSPTEHVLGQMAAAGVLRVAERSIESYPASPLRSARGTAEALLAAERDER